MLPRIGRRTPNDWPAISTGRISGQAPQAGCSLHGMISMSGAIEFGYGQTNEPRMFDGNVEKRGGKAMIVRSAPGSAVLALAIGCALAQSGAPAIAGPFSSMTGEWSGSGKLTYTNGTNERLRCRANYTVRTGRRHRRSQHSLCERQLQDRPHRIYDKRQRRGYRQMERAELQLRRSLTGRVNGSQVDAHAIGNTFSARLSMTTGEHNQSVTIRPETADVTQISVSFRKR